MSRRLTTCLVAVFTFTSALLMFLPEFAQATQAPDCSPISAQYPDGTPFGRCYNQGYFNSTDPMASVGQPGNDTVLPQGAAKGGFSYVDANMFAPGVDWAFPQNTETPGVAGQNFVDFMYSLVKDPLPICLVAPPADCGITWQREIAAAFIIDTMLGKDGTTFDTPNSLGQTHQVAGVTYAQQNFTLWKNKVLLYDAAPYGQGSGKPWVEWDSYQDLPNPHPNATSTNYHRDVDMFNSASLGTPTEPMVIIRFHNPDGSVYTINRGCGNSVGNLSALNYFDNTPKVTLTPTVASPGDPIHLWIQFTNNGTGYTPNVQLRGYNANNAYFLPSATTSYANAAPQGYYYFNYNYPPGVSPGPPGPGETSAASSYDFTVAASTPNGSYCFDGSVNPASDKPDNVVAERRVPGPCVTIARKTYPYLTTTGADVHAGSSVSCLTGAGPGSGSITGNTNTAVNVGSSGSYIVSANNSITKFGSGGNVTGSAQTMNNTPAPGFYGPICRQNLANTAATLAQLSGATFNGASSVNSLTDGQVSSLYNNPSPGALQPYIMSGGNNFGKNATIYVAGDVYITGNINYPASFPTNKIPGLGIVASGSIFIAPGVTHLDGYLWAGGAIATCSDATGAAAPGTSCQNALTVNGLMSANYFRFQRTNNAPGATDAEVSESVNYLAQLLLAPPPGFRNGGGVYNGQPQYGGEAPPRY